MKMEITPPEVTPPPAFSVIRGDSVDQMVLEYADAFAVQPGAPIVALRVDDVPEMLALATVTKPGPFGRRTIELGDYIGIRQRGVLVAMAGERMCAPGFREVSGVCTHPDYQGKGLARQLMQ